jgi:hypothetical protein
MQKSVRAPATVVLADRVETDFHPRVECDFDRLPDDTATVAA